MGDGPHRSTPSGRPGPSPPVGVQGATGSRAPGSDIDPVRSDAPSGSMDEVAGPGSPSSVPGQRALASAIAMLDHEPAVGLAIVDGQGRPLHANRRFIALTVPSQRGPTPGGEPVARKGVWARVGAEAVSRASQAGRPVVLRFIHDGAQVQLDIWPLPGDSGASEGRALGGAAVSRAEPSGATPSDQAPRVLARPAGMPSEAQRTPRPAAAAPGSSAAGEPRFLVLAVEGPCTIDSPIDRAAEAPSDAAGSGASSGVLSEADDEAPGDLSSSDPDSGDPGSGDATRPGQAVERKPIPALSPVPAPALAGEDAPFISMTPSVGEFGALSVLTSRELEVLALIGQGLATREIAEALGRSPRTIERHCDAIHKKLHTANRVQMARYAMRAGLTVESSRLKKV